ncbi:hypothetical protein [Endozoicomonas sp. 8E]|uniref:hypothetical protein n=1 Tax=Endozoicomonas sp. 8E TaxID=3035692 RepID=UPI0029394F96|nr:hypothetical protein [Endozoicomonas sp. 8E]WOG25574.1 hypothetical protein P6910_13370 [Endozoicomonas sp. 8E]
MKILSSLFLALVLPFCGSLWAANNEISDDGLPPYNLRDSSVHEKVSAVSERDRREALTGGASSGGSSKEGEYKEGSYKKSGHNLTRYLKSLVTKARIKLTKFMNGYLMTTPKKISVSINPIGKTMRGSQPINKIESKVRFQNKESNFIYYTLRGHALREHLFHLVLIEEPEDSSKLYLGYYEEDEDSVINTTALSSTPASIFLKNVLEKSDTSASAINGASTNITVLPPLSGQSANDTLIKTNLTSRNTIGLQGLMPKEPELKPFRPILNLEKGQDYSIEVVWKSKDAITSVTMSDTSSMTYTTTSTSPTASSSIQPSPVESSSILPSTKQIQPVPLAAIPENVGTEIIIKDKEGMTLATVNLDLEPGYFSLSDENGYLLEYGIDGFGIHQLTKIQTHIQYVKKNRSTPDPAKPEPEFMYNFIAGLVGFAVGCIGLVALINHCNNRSPTRLHEAPL